MPCKARLDRDNTVLTTGVFFKHFNFHLVSAPAGRAGKDVERESSEIMSLYCTNPEICHNFYYN